MVVQDPMGQLASARRVLVLGSPGSGKTTLTLRLARALGLEAIHLDAEFWKPGWVSTPQPAWREVVGALVQRDAWIMDGTYESTLDLRIPAADLLIEIKRSRLTCLYHVLRRKATIDDHARPDAPAGQALDWPFIRYIWNYPCITDPLVRERIQEYGPDKPVIEIRGHHAMRLFIAGLPASARRQAEASE
ncbi:MAG: hypothetical protein KDA60_12460 [Planctomycetales bacterium]|nr:hypothetical protein [Planctomycetales bacterium]